MRLLISSRYLGGSGGLERALFATLSALAEDSVDVVVAKCLGGEWGRTPQTVNVYDQRNWRWRGAPRLGRINPVNFLRRRLLPEYDAVVAYRWGPRVIATVRARTTMIIPAGGVLESADLCYDQVALEAPDNADLVPTGVRTLLLPPPLVDLSNRVECPNTALPAEFFLTVFNPYSKVKGADDLAQILDSTPLPILWCHSPRTLSFDIPYGLREHPNLIHVVDASPSQLRYLYARCYAYLAFSRSEGFGWALADALKYATRVVSRPIGVLSYSEMQDQSGVYLVGEKWRFDWSSFSMEAGAEPERDLSIFSPSAFRDRLMGALGD